MQTEANRRQIVLLNTAHQGVHELAIRHCQINTPGFPNGTGCLSCYCSPSTDRQGRQRVLRTPEAGAAHKHTNQVI